MTEREPHATDPSPLIVVPVYNDWDAFRDLLRGLEHVLRDAGLTARVLAVDDGSSDSLDERSILESPYRAVVEVNNPRAGTSATSARSPSRWLTSPR